MLPFMMIGLISGLFTAWMEHKFIIASEGDQYNFSVIERFLSPVGQSGFIWGRFSGPGT